MFTDRDNIHKIAKIYEVAPWQIAKINELDSINQKLLPYMKLIIPDPDYPRNTVNGMYIKTIKHKVGTRETLNTIARFYGTTVYDILLNNPNISRDKPLNYGDEIKLMVTVDSRSQFSKQLIYLNGDLLKYEEIVVKDSAKFLAALKYNEKFEKKHSVIAGDVILEEKIEEIEPLFDTFFLPKHDTSRMSKLIYLSITNFNNPSANKQKWLDLMYELTFYVHSEIKNKKNYSDHLFLVQAFNHLHKLNQKYPSNDYLFGLRSLMYYWLGNNNKAVIFSDEALSINPNNEPSLLVRAAIGLEDNHLEFALKHFTAIHQLNPNRGFSLFNLATINYQKNNFPVAIEFFKEALLKAPELAPEVNFKIGHSYILVGNDDLACEFIKLAENQGYPKAQALRTRNCK